MSRRPPKSTRTASRCAYPTLFRSDTLLGVPQTGPQKGYAAFAPVIEVFLKEHLFADIFERDVLTYAERALVTVSVLAGIGGVGPIQIGSAHVCTPVPNAHLQCRILLETKK